MLSHFLLSARETHKRKQQRAGGRARAPNCTRTERTLQPRRLKVQKAKQKRQVRRGVGWQGRFPARPDPPKEAGALGEGLSQSPGQLELCFGAHAPSGGRAAAAMPLPFPLFVPALQSAGPGRRRSKKRRRQKGEAAAPALPPHKQNQVALQRPRRNARPPPGSRQHSPKGKEPPVPKSAGGAARVSVSCALPPSPGFTPSPPPPCSWGAAHARQRHWGLPSSFASSLRSPLTRGRRGLAAIHPSLLPPPRY